MLPDFPGIKRDMHQRVTQLVRERARAGPGIASLFREHHQHEGEDFGFEGEDADGPTRPYEELTQSVTLTIEEIRTLGVQDIVGRLLAMGQEMARDVNELAHARISEWTEAAGTSVSNENQPLSAEGLLQMFERVDIEFDPDTGDFSDGTVVVVPPDLMPSLRRAIDQLETDPQLQARWTEIKRRKFEAWRDRENHRALVD